MKALLPNYYPRDEKAVERIEEKNEIFKVNVMKKTYGFKFVTAKRVSVKELCHDKKNTMQLESISEHL